jgi:hypothetical protein
MGIDRAQAYLLQIKDILMWLQQLSQLMKYEVSILALTDRPLQWLILGRNHSVNICVARVSVQVSTLDRYLSFHSFITETIISRLPQIVIVRECPKRLLLFDSEMESMQC